jgi:CBS domain-containing protein
VKQVRDPAGPGYAGLSLRAVAGFAIFAITHRMTVTAITEVGTFLDGATLDVPGTPRVIHVPGHTAGSVAFHLAARDTVFVGDAFVTRNVITVSPDISVEEATTLLHDNKIGCLPVVEYEKLVGILTRYDVIEYMAR